jgi:cytochrome c-L
MKKGEASWVSVISKHQLVLLILLVAIAAASAAYVSAQTGTEPSPPSAATQAPSMTPQPGGTPPSPSGTPATQVTPTPGPAQPATPPASAADLAAVLTPKAGDTPAVHQFKETGKNPYYKDPQAIAEGFKLARASSCTHCHGEGLGGLIGPSLTNGNWRYVKNGTDMGMFETLYFGTGAGMAAWGKLGSLTEDEILKVIAFVRSKYRGDPKNTTWE